MNKKNYIRCLVKAIFSLLCITGIAYTAKAQCPTNPPSISFIVRDSVNHTNIGNNPTLSCGANPIYIEADNNTLAGIVTPCVLSTYHIGLLSGVCANATETFYEGGNDLLCVGPSSSCVYPIGGGACTLGGYWGINKIYLDPSQQHVFQFCDTNSLSLLGGTTVQLQDCWSGNPLSTTKSFGGLISVGTPCFADTIQANTPIGTAIYSIAPATASVALTDYHNGKSLINPALLPSGNYTVSYTFIPPATSCPTTTVTGTFKFTIAPIPVSVNSPTICAGNTATLTASGPPAITYSWSPATNLSATTGSVVSANSLSTTAHYTVTGTLAACTATATSTITVNPIPTLTLSSAAICAGTTVALTAQGATNYSWTPSTGLSATTGSMVTATTPSTTVYTVTGTSTGCSSTKTTTVTVNQPPTIMINSPTICTGATATLTANGATTYSWNTSSISATITPSPAITTIYTVTGTTSGCSSVKTSTVTVNPTPTVTVNSATICAGGTATLTASGATTYSWSTAGTNASIAPSPTITTSYTVTGTNIFACKKSATSTITVNSLPIISVSNATICIGGTATLTASGATTYSWSTTATSISITPSPTITTNYTVTGTDANSCKNIATSTVTVNQLPTVTVNSPTICVGTTTTLTASGATTYSWSTSATSSTISVSPAASHTYEVIGTDIHACKNTAIATVLVNSLPIISVNTATVCQGNLATLNASGATTYTWNTAATGASITTSPTVTTTYTVIGTDVHACVNSATTTVSVNPLPIVNPSANTPVCIGQTIKLNANSTGSTIYNWSGPNGYTSSSQNPIIINALMSNAGTYTLSILSAGCTASNTVSVVVDALPTIANAGADTVTYTSSLSLNGNIPLVGTGIWTVISGGGNFLNVANPNTQVNNLQSGTNVLQWTISNGACPDSHDELTIFVKNLIVPNGFSPNGDGVNDVFEINGLEEYTNVKINVFNRWGNLVYDNEDYKNNWNGKNMSGEDLTDDTYFFTIEIPNKSHLKGYVVLKRK